LRDSLQTQQKIDHIDVEVFVANQSIPSPTIALATETARSVRWDPSLPKGQALDFALRLGATGHGFLFSPEPLMVWHDAAEEGRTSHSRGTEPARAFLAKNGGLLTPKARRGYAVSYLAYDLAQEQPLGAARELIVGALAGVPFRVVGQHLLRTFLPRRLYRRMVNTFVAAAGK
jgi:hypothetical protein